VEHVTGYVTRVDERSIDLRGAAVRPHLVDVVGGLVAGLAGGQPRIVTGIAMGPVAIAVERRVAPPAVVADGWEDVVEVSCRAVGDDVVAAGPYDDAPDPRLVIDPPGAGWFRLRVHARGRDLECDLVATEPREEYLLVSWPASSVPPAVLSAASGLARQLEAAQGRSGRVAAGAPATARDARRRESVADARRRAQAAANLLRVDRQQRER
jgi:hypothetical protein